jgi:hypothetical protein
MQKIFIKNVSSLRQEVFVAYSGSQLVKEILYDVRKLQMIPDQVAQLRLRQKQLRCGGRVDSSWLEGNDRQYNNCTKMFLLFNKQHKARSFEVSENVRTVGAQRTEGSRRN